MPETTMTRPPRRSITRRASLARASSETLLPSPAVRLLGLFLLVTACGGSRAGLRAPECEPALHAKAAAAASDDELAPKAQPYQPKGDAPLLRVVRQVGHADKMFGVRFSRDGKFVATGAGDRSIKIWDAASGRLLFSDDRYDDQVTAIDLAPDRAAALAGTRSGTLVLIDLERGERRELEPRSDFMSSVRISQDGKRAIGGARGRAKLWDLTSGKALAELDTKGHPIETCAFTPDGPVIAIKQYRSVRILALETGKKVFELNVPDGKAIGAAAFSRDGKYLIVGRITPYEIDVFDSKTYRKLVTLPGQHYEINDAEISADGRTLVSTGRDGTLNFWDMASASLLRKVKLPDGGASVDFSPDGQRVIVGYGERLFQQSGASIIDVATGKTQVALKGAEQNTVAAGLTSDGQHAMVASNGQAVTFWDLGSVSRVSAESLGNLSGIRGASGFDLHDIKDAAVSADGKIVAAVGGGSSFIKSDITGYTLVRVLDTGTGQSRLLKNEVAGRIDDLALSPDGGRVAIAQWNGYQLSSADLWIWDVEQEKVLRHLHRTGKDVGVAVAQSLFTRDGRRLFWGGDEDFQLYDIDQGSAVRVFEKADAVRSIALTSDERYVATSGSGVQVWEVATGRKRTLGDGKTWHGTSPIAWVDNGAHLLVTDGFSRLDVWNVEQNRVERTIPIAFGGLKSLSTSRDGKRAIASSTDGTARVIDLTSGASVQLLAEGGQWLAIDDEGYFDASRNGGELVNLVAGLESFRIDQLAARNNRPDRLLERLHAGSPELIAHFHARHVRRLERLGLSERDLEQPFAGAPRVSLGLGAMSGRQVRLPAHFESHTPLRSYQVYVNQVPVLGSAGAPLSSTSADVIMEVPLTYGQNRVEVSATNESGVESLRPNQSFTLRDKAPRKLYFLAFGVSHYRNSAFDLSYAHKDALDLTEVARQMAGKVYASVVTRAFIDGEVTRGAFNQAKALLAEATPDDTLVVFIAGHGGYSRDAAAEYYFLTHEADPERLRATAAPFELVEDLLRDVKPRQKLLMVDTCDSGDRDPGEAAAFSAPIVGGSRAVRSRAVRALTLASLPHGTQPARRAYLFDRDRYIYNDLVRRTGAIVLSSARGAELSYETGDAQNGVFTEEILRALTTGVADANHDGIVDDRELRGHVARAVARQTNNLQHPVVDTDNPELRVELPVVTSAVAVLTREDPLARGPTAARGMGLSASGKVQAQVNVELGGGAYGAPCARIQPPSHGCGCRAGGASSSGWAALLLLATGLCWWRLRGRRKRPSPRQFSKPKRRKVSSISGSVP
jgi:WD40 repeat protein